LRQETDGVKGLLPLLFHSLQQKQVLIARRFQTYLRTAYARDEIRSRSYSSICRKLTAGFAGAGIPAIVLKGAALAETAYQHPTLQHAHYLEMLIKHSDLDRAAEVLPSLGFVQPRDSVSSGWPEVEWVHESRLPLILHWDLFRVPFYRVALAEIWSRSRIQAVSGTSTRVLSPADNLTHICASRFDVGHEDSLRWVCDAWFLIHRYPNLDWEVFLNHANGGPLALPLFMTVSYLAEQLNAPIPADVLNRLGAAASKSETIGSELALFGALRNARGGLMKVLQNCGSWSTRALVMQWALFPSPRYLRWYHEVTWSWLLPFYYFYRPLRYLVRSVWFLNRRLLRRFLESLAVRRTESKAIFS
jgi:hypothetical protein